ncbi:hypothetical protein ACIBJE_24255 [Micromonospora sp. NPDC050187]|uniref:hypothetical protein n=1 Tax=Micromonospora sp. NPDC050187 TaxID=3364277 RepID=UPI0037B27BEB
MPKQLIEQDKRDTERLWPTLRADVPPPTQARYDGGRTPRAGDRSWAELNRLPANLSTRRHLGAR